ncbi:sporulation protein [Paenibacillus sp. 7124]|uniref:Sporulation protein n=1 Tax=Paenibacillus apii TaxID=1850370 RepID=A0A6M1PP02_9BACL|nr:Spo0B domain-containing protein [Paenibacillus apii]NGM83533.1 sporulation protein [Paenibacillus apii]NJJ41684.1 sporulation protein [Paenibacillus apii]
MKSWKSVIGAAVLSVAFPLGLASIWPALWSSLVLGLWAVAAALISVATVRRHYEREIWKQERILQQTAIRMLTHHRHDWMNDLQVLYGYIQLGKPDKSVQCVERIKERIALDSRIAKLGIPSLVFYLQSFRTVGGSLQLDIEVEEGLHLEDLLTPEAGDELTSVIMQMVRACQFGGMVAQGDTRMLRLSFKQDEGDIVIVFGSDGLRGRAEAFQQQILNIVQGKIVKAERLASHKADFQLRLPMGM